MAGQYLVTYKYKEAYGSLVQTKVTTKIFTYEGLEELTDAQDIEVMNCYEI
jgi:hypothetical protein